MINKLGVHSLVWTGHFDADGARDAIRQSKESGFDLLEISLHQPELLDIPMTRKYLEEYDLAVAGSRGLDFDADPSSDDPDVVARGEQILNETLQMIADLGGHYFGGALYSALGKYGHALTEQGRDNAVGVVSRLAKRASDVGVTLGLEICNRYETNVMNTAAECLRFIDDTGADNVVVHLDTYHMNIEEQDFVRPVLQAGDRLGYVHVGENNRGYLGSGHIDFTGFFHALADIGYGGPITFESFSSEVVTPGLSDNLAVWRDLWDDGADLARHAHDFVAEHVVAAGR